MNEHLLDVHITKNFEKLTVLKDVKFHVNKNEFLVIVGPTSCGKTTLANILSGIDTNYEGEVKLFGERVDPKRHNISYVFQEPSCIPWYTMIQDVTMGPIIKGMAPAKADGIGRHCIKLVGLEGFEQYYPRQISGGMKQRVAIARGFVTEPDLLLMDEPFGQLDTQTRFHIENSLIKLWERKKQTIIFVTHNLEEAVYLSERILVLTPKPAKIKEEVFVSHLAHPRNIQDPEFVRLRRKVTDLVRWW